MTHKYKQTEITKISKEWDIVKLSDVALDFISGGTPSTKTEAYWNGKIPWMTSAHINGKTIENSMQNITEEGVKNSATNIVPANNILMATRVGIGKIAINLIDIAISQDLTGIVLDQKKINNEYAYWVLLNYANKLARLSQGSTIKGLLRDEIKRIEIPLPSLLEQKKITEILSTVDAAIEKIDKAIEKTERLKKGLMHELLANGIGHKEFKDTEIGRIPKEWKVVKLNEKMETGEGLGQSREEPKICDIIMGQSPPSSTYNKEGRGLPFLQGNAEFGDIYPTSTIYCSEPVKIAEPNDVLISVRAPVGDINIANCRSCIGRGLTAIRANDNVLNFKYLFYFLKDSIYTFEKISVGSTFKALRKEEIEGIKIVLPLRLEQQKITGILETIDKKIEVLLAKNQGFEKIKICFMNDLLTGKKRVKL